MLTIFVKGILRKPLLKMTGLCQMDYPLRLRSLLERFHWNLLPFRLVSLLLLSFTLHLKGVTLVGPELPLIDSHPLNTLKRGGVW